MNEKRYAIATRCDFNSRSFFLATFEIVDEEKHELKLVEEQEFTRDDLLTMTYDQFMNEYELFASIEQTRH